MKTLSANELAATQAGFNVRCDSRFSFKTMPFTFSELLVITPFILCRLRVWEIK